MVRRLPPRCCCAPGSAPAIAVAAGNLLLLPAICCRRRQHSRLLLWCCLHCCTAHACCHHLQDQCLFPCCSFIATWRFTPRHPHSKSIFVRYVLRLQMNYDGIATAVDNIYISLSHVRAADSRFKDQLATHFNQEYEPHDVGRVHAIIREFATLNGFAVHDLNQQVARTCTVDDLIKLYSTCVKLAMGQPMTLFYLAPDIASPHSLTVLEGLFAVRATLLSGRINILFRDRRGSSKMEIKCMRHKQYNICLFQNDNLILLNNCTMLEIKRELDVLITECPICLESLVDVTNGQIQKPSKCGHSFHQGCARKLVACPVCRETRMMREVGFTLI